MNQTQFTNFILTAAVSTEIVLRATEQDHFALTKTPILLAIVEPRSLPVDHLERPDFLRENFPVQILTSGVLPYPSSRPEKSPILDAPFPLPSNSTTFRLNASQDDDDGGIYIWAQIATVPPFDLRDQNTPLLSS